MRAISALAIGVFLVCPGAALAEPEGAVVQGTGYKVGEGTVIMPTVGLESEYTSNVFYESTDENPKASGILRVLAGLSLTSLPPSRLNGVEQGGNPKIEFVAGAQLAYEQYLSSATTVQDQSNLSGNIRGKFTAGPRSAIRFTVDESLTRHTRPVNFESSGDLNRDINLFKLSLGWHPIGRTIAGIVRYENVIDRFESDASAFANRLQHTIGVRVNWHYLPVTEFYLDASQGIYGQLGDSTLNGEKVKQDALPLRIVVGANSAITESTTMRLHAGFAAGFYDVGPSYTTAVYGVGFGFRYSPLGRLLLEFDRSFADSINANFYGEYRFRAGVEQQVAKFLLVANAMAGFRQYEGVPSQVSGDSTRSDLVLGLSAEGRYYYREWLAVTAGYDLRADETDFRSMVGTGSDDPSYVRHVLGMSILAAF